MAYRAAARFFAWCDHHKIGEIVDIEPLHVAAYVEALGKEFEKPMVKQHLAAIRMLFDWLVVGQIVATNPAHSVRGPKPVARWAVGLAHRRRGCVACPAPSNHALGFFLLTRSNGCSPLRSLGHAAGARPDRVPRRKVDLRTARPPKLAGSRNRRLQPRVQLMRSAGFQRQPVGTPALCKPPRKRSAIHS